MTSIDSAARPNDVSLVGGPGFYQGAVTPDSLYLYLSSRLQGLDGQINVVFKRQEVATEVRGSLNRIQSELAKLEDYAEKNPNDKKSYTLTAQDGENTFNLAIDRDLRAIENLDPKLGAELRQRFTGQSGILHAGPPGGDTTFTASELKASQETVKNTLSDLEASAALDMIRLQSSMSTRQTAIQLATNVTGSLSESAKAIVGNLGR